MSNLSYGPDIELIEKEDVRVKRPRKYQIILHNDNYSTMDFVIEVLMAVFHKPFDEANQKMIEIHKKGKSIVGVYTREIAESKIVKVEEMARQNQFPLKATMEEAP